MTGGIEREDVRLTTTDEGPALEVGDMEILLRTFVKTEDESDELWGEETVTTDVEIDCDGDNGCWFNLVSADDDTYPWVSIQPEIRYIDTETNRHGGDS